MSQRNVNLRNFNYGQQSQKFIDRSYQASMGIVSRLAKQQEEQRKKSEEAMLLGDATAERLTEEYTKKLGSASAETRAALTAYAREQAELIGAAKTKAFSPGATQEDKNNYYKTLSQGTSNLEAIASYSTLAADDLSIYKRHLSAKSKGVDLGALTQDALKNNETIGFNAGLSTGFAENIVVKNNDKGHAEISFVDQTGKKYNQDIWAAQQAFNQTGDNLKSQVITDEDLITNQKFLESVGKQVDGFNDIKSTTENLEIIDLNKNTKTKITRFKRINVGDVLYNNHKDYLQQEMMSGGDFNKKWDQLGNLGYLNDPFGRGDKKEYKNIAWSTFNQKDVKTAVEQLNKSGALEDLAGDDKKFDEKEYLEIQKDIRDYAARGYANFLDSRLGQDVDYKQKTSKYIETGDTEGQKKLADYTEIYNNSNNIKNLAEELKQFDYLPRANNFAELMDLPGNRLAPPQLRIKKQIEDEVEKTKELYSRFNNRFHSLGGTKSTIININDTENPPIQVTEEGIVFNIYKDDGSLYTSYNLSNPEEIINLENNLTRQKQGVSIGTDTTTSALNTLTN